MSKVNGQRFTVLKNKKTVITRANFWKVPHNTRDDEIHLKVGRYKKPKNWREPEIIDLDSPRSELTLDGEEFDNLVSFIKDNYEPFKHGTKAFIPIDNPYDPTVAQQMKQLLCQTDKVKMLKYLLENEVIPEDLEVGLVHARRSRAIDNFQALLELDYVESKWQEWFEENSWVLGSDFVRTLDERWIDTKNISDFLMQSYDGFLDVVEIKRPDGDLKFWHSTLDHGNYIPHSDLIKAITQSIIYIHKVEKRANDIDFFENVGHVKVIKPRCTLIYGRSKGWNMEQQEAFRVLNSSYHNLTIITFDHVIERARRIIGKLR